jgi:HlyD family secretion protein
MIRRLIVLVVAVSLIGGGIYLYRKIHRPGEVVLTGIVTTHEVTVSPLIQGRLDRLLVKEGDTVAQGQLLASIDPQELQADRAFYAHAVQGASDQVEQQEAALSYQRELVRDQIRQAEAVLAAAEAQSKEVVADLELNRLNLGRAEELYKKQVYPAQSVDQARSAFQTTQARAESLRRLVESQRAAVAVARANEDQIAVQLKTVQAGRTQVLAATAQKSKADVRLGYAEVHSPIQGIVAVLAVRQGEVVGVNQTILTLINPEDLWVRADVEESYIEGIHLGDALTVRLPSGVEKPGTVFYRSVVADFATQRDVSRSKRDIRTFEIRLRLDNRDRGLWPGLTAYIILPRSVVQGASEPRAY